MRVDLYILEIKKNMSHLCWFFPDNCGQPLQLTVSVVKEYHSRSVAVLTPSIGFAPQHIPGIRPIYKMPNISERSKRIFSKLSGFLASVIWDSHTKNYSNRGCQFWGRRWERNFLNPRISPYFGHRELKIYEPLDFHGLHLVCEFCDPSPKNGAWGDDCRNLKFQLFGRVSISHQNPVQWVKGT